MNNNPSAAKGRFKFWERIPTQEKINFSRHLALTLKAGLPLLESLKIIQKQASSKKLQQVIGELLKDVENGQFLAQGLEKHRQLFGDFFINIIRIGEESGTLSQNLLYLADEIKKAQELKSKIRSAMIYPLVIFLATIGITVLLTFSVFPKVLPVFSSLKITLPLTTKILIAVFGFLLNYGWLVLLGLVFLIILFRIALHFEKIKFFFDRTLFFIPIVSSLTVGIAMANFTRTIGLLLKSGVKIVEAVNITAYTMTNLVYREALLKAADGIRRGEQFVNFLGKDKRLFPPLLSSLIEIGENTGNLEENLFYLSEYYTGEIDVLVKNLTSLLEPLLLLVMGIIVGFVALSIITPIYEVTSGIRP